MDKFLQLVFALYHRTNVTHLVQLLYALNKLDCSNLVMKEGSIAIGTAWFPREIQRHLLWSPTVVRFLLVYGQENQANKTQLTVQHQFCVCYSCSYKREHHEFQDLLPCCCTAELQSCCLPAYWRSRSILPNLIRLLHHHHRPDN